VQPLVSQPPIKNRFRDKYSFANINLLGRCNADCYFCLGKDIKTELADQNQLQVPYSQWQNFERFLMVCEGCGVKKLYITGQTADGLQYKYLDELVDYLQNKGFVVGVRTNGYLALNKMATIRKMKDEIGYSIHTLNTITNKIIMGVEKIPDWDKIIPLSGDNVRIAIVLNRYNINEFDDIVKYVSKFSNVKYIQVRRISTDTRLDELSEDIQLFEKFFNAFHEGKKEVGKFCLAPSYELYGKQISFWRTIETSCNSLNYFTDGTCSDEYFVVEGYLKYCRRSG
jgi:MoaA/NifB/PqqE/SkfB family radical SAM enzyme